MRLHEIRIYRLSTETNHTRNIQLPLSHCNIAIYNSISTNPDKTRSKNNFVKPRRGVALRLARLSPPVVYLCCTRGFGCAKNSCAALRLSGTRAACTYCTCTCHSSLSLFLSLAFCIIHSRRGGKLIFHFAST